MKLGVITNLLLVLWIAALEAGSVPERNVNVQSSNNGKKARGLAAVRNSRRTSRSKFPLRAEENRRKSKRAGGKCISPYY